MWYRQRTQPNYSIKVYLHIIGIIRNIKFIIAMKNYIPTIMDDIHYNYNAYNRTSTYILESILYSIGFTRIIFGVLVGHIRNTVICLKISRNYKIMELFLYTILLLVIIIMALLMMGHTTVAFSQSVLHLTMKTPYIPIGVIVVFLVVGFISNKK